MPQSPVRGAFTNDSVTRVPIANVLVRLDGPAGFVPNTHLLDLNGAGVDNNLSTTGVNGLYEFIFINNPPAGTYTLVIVSAPTGYLTTPAVKGNVAQPGEINGVVTTTWIAPGVATDMQPGYVTPGGTPPVGTAQRARPAGTPADDPRSLKSSRRSR